jgi:hypothetical protein
MHQLISFFKKHWFFIAVLGFILSRWYIFLNPPPYVRYFEEYANIWYYGLPPYLKHWFEYPPATIPFISGPLLLDLSGVGSYRINFRVMTLVVDTLTFLLMMAGMSKLKLSSWTKLFNVGFYLLLTIKAKDFMYENLDTVFALTMLIPAVVPLLIERGKTFVQWLFFWLGTGVKLVNAPLGLVYILDEKRTWLQKIVLSGIACALIWAVPVVIFRSSLGVIIEYHKSRTLQVESFPSLVVRGINVFTKSETIYFSNFKSFDLQGPVSNVMLPVANVTLVVVMAMFAAYVIRHRHIAHQPVFMMKATLIFIFSYFLANKVFSTPYHLWYVPFIVIYPYRSWKERAFFFITSGIFLSVATSPIPSVEVFKGIFLDATLPVVTQVPATVLLLIGAYRLKVEEEERSEKKVHVATEVVETSVKKKKRKK